MKLLTSGPKYTAISLADLYKLPDPEWLVERWAMRQAVTVLTGESESFKTFLAMDMAVKCADPYWYKFGPHWIDRTTVGGGPIKTLYVIGESVGASKLRFKAIGQHHKRPDPGFESLAVYPNNVDIFGNAAGVIEFVDEIDPDIVVFDTFSKNTYGVNENEKTSVDVILKASNELRRGGTRGGRSIIFIHHPNKAGSALRGHTSLLNDTDIAIKVERFGKKSESPRAPFYTKVISERQKEADDFFPYYAKLDTHHMLDDDGVTPLFKVTGSPPDPLTTLVITDVDGKPDGIALAEATGKARPAPMSAELLNIITATPRQTRRQLQAALYPDNPTGTNVYDMIKDLASNNLIQINDDGTVSPLDALEPL